MKLNHLNICTSDPIAAADFFGKYFGFARSNTRPEAPIALVRDETGFTLLFSNLSKHAKPIYPEGFHFGFIVASREEVDRHYLRLSGDNYASNPPKEMHGSYTFYFVAPGDFMMEIQCVLNSLQRPKRSQVFHLTLYSSAGFKSITGRL